MGGHGGVHGWSVYPRGPNVHKKGVGSQYDHQLSVYVCVCLQNVCERENSADQ